MSEMMTWKTERDIKQAVEISDLDLQIRLFYHCGINL